MLAVLFGHDDVARLLFLKGANPAIVDGQGNTAIRLAKAQGNGTLAQLLGQPLFAKK